MLATMFFGGNFLSCMSPERTNDRQQRSGPFPAVEAQIEKKRVHRRKSSFLFLFVGNNVRLKQGNAIFDEQKSKGKLLLDVQ